MTETDEAESEEDAVDSVYFADTEVEKPLTAVSLAGGDGATDAEADEANEDGAIVALPSTPSTLKFSTF